ncbi:MAG: ABC transporter permease [Actinobacteria bacterium]|nr:ABC transporter permease [Actinomycetota bacterium]
MSNSYIKKLNLIGRNKFVVKTRENVIYIIVLIMFIIFAVLLKDKGFLSVYNLMNILRQTALISILAVSFSLLIAAAEFDLSAGSVIALSSLVGAMALREYGIIAGVISALAVGALIGGINGFFIVKVKIPAFLMTLATMGIVRGIARWITDLRSVPVANERFRFIFGGGSIGKLPLLFIWTIVIMVIGHLVLKKTTFGRKILAVGGNKIAAKFVGINAEKIKWMLFIVMSMTSALVGLLYNGRLGAASYFYGEEELFIVVAAVVIGGNSVYGGKATIIGAIIGSIIIGIINNGLILLGFSVDQQLMFRGIIIVLAVGLSPKEAFGTLD